MANITINERNNTLVITKKFEKAANKFGSPEYKELKEAKADFPNFKVVVRNTKKKEETYKGLTYEYMKKYIEKHDVEGKIMDEFKIRTGQTEDSMKKGSYVGVKKWFLSIYPEFEAFHTDRQEAAAEEIEKARAAAKENKEAA